ncbi:PRC-barrel domain-containing protein [Cohaesibacter sp. ES.047]|uniref:PRC-barrel domain-containing protein n=1 Tax=Cohaesibacter sp. ES.047 TaxID=1798205 RepID=UPI000BB72FDC|nr:PRC-barrel domain-containing protein [Cohaesibacter sp. ES.047]SNY90359.1 PRC-barrel domain-containing protein [Cohaesibacter sp. ES.047]
MKRILATTAMGLMLTTAAMAETPMGSFNTINTVAESDIFASNFIGMRIYSAQDQYDSFDESSTVAAGAETDWDDLGEVNDIVLDRNGSVKAVVLGVGGFLGIGEKDVAVDMNSIKMVNETDDPGTFFLVVKTDKATLENAPEFERPMNDVSAMGVSGADIEKTMQNGKETAENSYESMKDDVKSGYESAKDKVSKTMDETQEGLNSALNQTGETMKKSYDETRSFFVAPEVEFEGYEVASSDQMTADDLTGARLYSANDEDIGEVDQLVLNKNGSIDKAVLDVGGFLGVNEHRIAVNMDELSVLRSSESGMVRVYINATQEELEAQPEYQPQM